MSISLSRYVDITSGVGAASAVSTRDLTARLFSTNPLIPTGSFLTFTSATDVGSYFGTSSEEYARAVFYFGWISKNITRDQSISFARYVDAASAPQIFGVKGQQAIATWNAITAGSFKLTIAGTQHAMTALNFGAAANLAAVAAIIQTAVRAADVAAVWASATVVYNSTRGSFDFTGGAAGVATISVQAGTTGTDIASQLGWLSATDTIISDGAAATDAVTAVSDSADASNNFGSFAFLPTLTQDEIVDVAEWNLAQNVQFLYSVRCTSANAAALSAALADIGGVTLTLAPISTEYPEQVPMMILAATDYTAINSTQNYMFQIFNLTPSVTTNANKDLYDGLRVNYYGQTQQAGQQIQFYQNGLMLGLPVDPADQNTYANELWLKDAAAAALMTLLLALSKVSANSKGRSQVLAILQSVVNLAILNGTISVGKPLTTTQKLYIAEQTGDEKAWYQVQNQGYWLDARIVSYVESSVTKYKIVYTLIYSKDDVIRKIEGRDILI